MIKTILQIHRIGPTNNCLLLKLCKVVNLFPLQVTILNESHYPDWDINEFRMMRGDTVLTMIMIVMMIMIMMMMMTGEDHPPLPLHHLARLRGSGATPDPR